jgi:hypothetical protein
VIIATTKEKGKHFKLALTLFDPVGLHRYLQHNGKCKLPWKERRREEIPGQTMI